MALGILMLVGMGSLSGWTESAQVIISNTLFINSHLQLAIMVIFPPRLKAGHVY